MKLSRKEFKILQLVDNRDDYSIEETLYILGVSWCYGFYGVDGLGGIIPFSRFSSAEDKLSELEQLEEVEGKLRDGSIMLFLIFTIVILFGMYKLIF
jgi:hypothetical protein